MGRPAHLSVRSRPTCGHAPLSRHRALQIPGISSTVNDLSAPSARPLGCVGLGGGGCQRNQPGKRGRKFQLPLTSREGSGLETQEVTNSQDLTK